MNAIPLFQFPPSDEQLAEDRHVAMRAPALAAAYMADPKQLADALGHIAMYLRDYPGLLLALQNRDGCEVGYQIDLAMAHYLADKAQDDVLDELWQGEHERMLKAIPKPDFNNALDGHSAGEG